MIGECRSKLDLNSLLATADTLGVAAGGWLETMTKSQPASTHRWQRCFGAAADAEAIAGFDVAADQGRHESKQLVPLLRRYCQAASVWLKVADLSLTADACLLSWPSKSK